MLVADTGSFVIVLSCSGNTFDGCVPASINPLEIRGAEVTLQEEVAPSGTIDGGELVANGRQAGVRSLHYSVADQESGVAQIAVVLGTTVVATQDYSGECAHTDFAACPLSRSGWLAVDTRKIPDGNYPLSLRVTDAADNRESILAPAAIEIENRAVATPPNGVGATGDARLTATFVGRRRSALTVSYNKQVAIRGRLTTTTGKPISKARVEVMQISAQGRRPRLKATAVTRADGTFRYTSTRRMASRTLMFQYRSRLGDPSVSASDTLRLNVMAAGMLQVALRGVRVSYQGRVLSKPIPRGGKLIYVEGRAVGGAWTAFAMKRTNRLGGFSGRYRLRVHRPGVRLQFRIRIPKEPSYPYAAGVGSVVTRLVR